MSHQGTGLLKPEERKPEVAAGTSEPSGESNLSRLRGCRGEEEREPVHKELMFQEVGWGIVDMCCLRVVVHLFLSGIVKKNLI